MQLKCLFPSYSPKLYKVVYERYKSLKRKACDFPPLHVLANAASSSAGPVQKKTKVNTATPTTLKPKTRKPAMLSLRTSPIGLYTLVRELSDDQKEAVRDIGFGSLLSLGISRCPLEMCRHLLEKFDPRSSLLVVSNGELLIDEEDVQCVLGLPRGDLEIAESIGKPCDGPEYLEMLGAWRTRWVGNALRGAPFTASMGDRIKANTAADDDFKRDFVVYVVSSFLWGTQNSQCRFRILKSLINVNRIKDLNWCKFTLLGLADSVRKWQDNPLSYFHGPLTFLLLCYMDRVAQYTVSGKFNRIFPILSCWDDKMVSERKALEEKHGGFCRGRVVERIQLKPICPAHVPVDEAAQKVLQDACQQLLAMSSKPFPFLSCIQSLEETIEKMKELYNRTQSVPSPSSPTLAIGPSPTVAIHPSPTVGIVPSTSVFNVSSSSSTSEQSVPSASTPTEEYLAPISSPTLANVPPISFPTKPSDPPIPSPTVAKIPFPSTSTEQTVPPISAPTVANVAPFSSPTLATVPPFSSPTLATVAPISFPTLATVPPISSPTLAKVPFPSTSNKQSVPLISSPTVANVPPPSTPTDQTEEEPVPVSVEYPEPSQRPKRIVKVPVSLGSPYVMEIRRELTTLKPLDTEVLEYVFAEGMDLEELLYRSPTTSLKRRCLLTMKKGEWLTAGIVDAWADEMNRVAQNDPRQPKRRVFFSTLHCACLDAEQELYNASLAEEMKGFHFSVEQLFKADLIFLPIAWAQHFYLTVYNIKENRFEIIDNMPLPKDIPFMNKYGVLERVCEKFLGFLSTMKPARAKKLAKSNRKLLKMPWQDNSNVVDCGIYCMRHMEAYFGQSQDWDCGLTSANCSKKLHFWRMKYLSRLLQSGNNYAKWHLDHKRSRLKLLIRE